VDFPLIGKKIHRGETDISVYRRENRARLISPVSGIVTGANAGLKKGGGVVNRDPYADGWMLRVHTEDLRNELKDLMIGTETTRFFSEEIARLYHVIESAGGPMATDGGYPGNDIYGNLPQIGWDNLTRMFLRASS
jgi:hypothetical protein